MAGLMQGHEVKLLRGGHRASPTHGTTAASSPGCCIIPSQGMLLGRFFSQVSITPPSLPHPCRPEVGQLWAAVPTAASSAFPCPLRGDE